MLIWGFLQRQRPTMWKEKRRAEAAISQLMPSLGDDDNDIQQPGVKRGLCVCNSSAENKESETITHTIEVRNEIRAGTLVTSSRDVMREGTIRKGSLVRTMVCKPHTPGKNESPTITFPHV